MSWVVPVAIVLGGGCCEGLRQRFGRLRIVSEWRLGGGFLDGAKVAAKDADNPSGTAAVPKGWDPARHESGGKNLAGGIKNPHRLDADESIGSLGDGDWALCAVP